MPLRIRCVLMRAPFESRMHGDNNLRWPSGLTVSMAGIRPMALYPAWSAAGFFPRQEGVPGPDVKQC